MSKVSVKNLTIKYSDDFIALDKATFELDDKTITALCGLSGSGKTSIAYALCGLVDFDGEILIDGNVLPSVKTKTRRVGFVPYELNLICSTVYKNLIYSNKIRKQTIPVERLAQITEICGLNEIMNRKISSLSYEEKKRVALARLFMRDNGLYIIDCEMPELSDEIIRLTHLFEATVLYLTTQNDAVCNYADKRILLREGKIQDEKNLFSLKFFEPLLNVCKLTVIAQKASSPFYNGKIDLADGEYYIAITPENMTDGQGAEVEESFEQSGYYVNKIKGISYFIYSRTPITKVGTKQATIFDLQGKYIKIIT